MKQRRFDDRLRAWGRRPAATRPDAAARRVVEILPASRRPVGAWAALALCVALLGGALYQGLRGQPSAPEGLEAHSDTHHPQPLPENVVQWWLDARTPVYFVIRPLEIAEGGAQ